jgi:hypothetical protein
MLELFELWCINCWVMRFGIETYIAIFTLVWSPCGILCVFLMQEFDQQNFMFESFPCILGSPPKDTVMQTNAMEPDTCYSSPLLYHLSNRWVVLIARLCLHVLFFHQVCMICNSICRVIKTRIYFLQAKWRIAISVQTLCNYAGNSDRFVFLKYVSFQRSSGPTRAHMFNFNWAVTASIK